MSFMLIHRDPERAVLATSPLAKAADHGSLAGALDLLLEARRIRDGAAAEVARAMDAARVAGEAEGRAAAERAVAAEHGGRLFALELAAAEERSAARAEAPRLALAMVRRVAAELGDADVVAAIAARVLSEQRPTADATVRVAPSAVAAVRRRLGEAVVVIGDPSLRPTDCSVETPLGRTIAGLDVQLAQLERALKEHHGNPRA